MRVGAPDVYVHELVSQRLLEIFQGARPTCAGYLKIPISNDTLMRIRWRRSFEGRAVSDRK
jgi:hypothetical protein